MRLLANENIPKVLTEALRDMGHDVTWIREAAPGSLDEVIVATASEEDRILLTQDKDFGELAFRSRNPRPPGVILLRVPPESPSHLARYVSGALQSRDDWRGHFAVIEPGRIRMTPLPE